MSTKEDKKRADAYLQLLDDNPGLKEMYQQNAGLGAKNLGGEGPLLKIHTTGKSTTNKLKDGSDPTDGYFFYKPTKEQFDEINCHILTISRGYRADGFQGKKDVFHQIMAGVITGGDKVKPFIMYMTGKKLQPMWNFGKEAGQYTKQGPVPIPMFALNVKLTTEQVKTPYGNSWIVNFTIVRGETGFPVVVTDMDFFNYLKDHVGMVESTIQNLIEAKATDAVSPDDDEVNRKWREEVAKDEPPEGSLPSE